LVEFFFVWQAFKILLWEKCRFQKEKILGITSSCLEKKILKVFLHLPPPSERESLVKVVGFIIQRLDVLSIQKGDCEKNLLKITYSNLQ